MVASVLGVLADSWQAVGRNSATRDHPTLLRRLRSDVRQPFGGVPAEAVSPGAGGLLEAQGCAQTVDVRVRHGVV